MSTFRITEQEARVTERSYDVQADSLDAAQEAFEELDGDDKAPLLVHSEVVRSNVEIIGVEETS